LSGFDRIREKRVGIGFAQRSQTGLGIACTDFPPV